MKMIEAVNFIAFLAFVFTDLVTDFLNSEKYKLSWEIVLDSFQNPYINR